MPNDQELSHAAGDSRQPEIRSENRPALPALGQLLGIAQRTVLMVYGDYKQRFSPRKLIPTEAKTVGDLLLLNRIKANLSQPELAMQTGFTVRKIMAWEHDRMIPSELEWRILTHHLNLNETMHPQVNR